jgi:hypothetical protein
MRPDRVEVTPPAFDDDLSLAQRVEDFAIEQFIPQEKSSLVPLISRSLPPTQFGVVIHGDGVHC